MEQVKIRHGKRDDPLRPKVFDPANVEIVAFIDTKPPQPPTNMGYLPGVPADVVRALFAETLEEFRKHREWWEARNVAWFGQPYPAHQCDHCGAHIRWAYVIKWLPTGQHFVVGSICGDERMVLPNRAAFDQRAERMKAEAAKVRLEALTLKVKWVQANPAEAQFMATTDFEWGTFMADLRGKLERYGYLTEKQTACVTREITYHAKKVLAQAAEAELLKNAPVVITGRYTVTGEIVHTRAEEGYMPGTETLKMLIKTDAGNKFWCTVPESLFDGEQLKGRTVAIAATWTAKDEHFAYGKRPREVR